MYLRRRWTGLDVFEAFVIVYGGFFTNREENVNKVCHPQPALYGSKWDVLVRYQPCDGRLAGLDIVSDLPLLESDPQGND